MWQIRVESGLVRAWLVATLVAAVAVGLLGHMLVPVFALVPARVWHGEIWRLATWVAIEPSPMQVVFTLIAIHRFGGDLARRWGDVRLARYAAEVVLATGLCVCVLGLVGGNTWYVGGWTVSDILVIAWARQFPTRDLGLFYGALVVRGERLIAVTIAANVLFALYHAPSALAPELIACALAALYPAARLRR